MANKTYQFKLVMLGYGSVGKSSIVIRFVKGQFSDYQESTIGAAFLTQTVPVQDCTVKFEIWDTAGQERYHSLAPMYYRGAAAAVVVYDITSQESFHSAKSWIKELQTYGDDGVRIVLAGNKIDREEDREVTAAEAKQYAEDNSLYFIETSAKSNVNIRETFYAIARQLPKEPCNNNEKGFILDEDSYQYQEEPKKGGCCENMQIQMKKSKPRNVWLKEVIQPNENAYNGNKKLKDWLTNIVKLPQYFDTFVSNDISLAIIEEITKDDLKDIGITSIGHIRTILKYASTLEQEPQEPQEEGVDDSTAYM
eukprot:262368_1